MFLGMLLLMVGVFDDVVFWCVLVLVLVVFGVGLGVVVLVIGGGIIWVVFVLLVGCWLLVLLGCCVEFDGLMSYIVLGIMLICFCVLVFVMDVVGIYVIFGGFIFGVVMLCGLFVIELKKKVEFIVVVLLLLMFFIYLGLNMWLDMINFV